MKIIAISAKQGAGKTTLADALATSLSGCGRTRFAKALYEMHDAILSILGRYGFERALDKRLLQLLGTEWGRQCVDENIWVKCLLAEAKRYEAAGMKYLIIDDCRFKNEFTALKEIGAVLIRLECDETSRKARCSQWRDTTTHQSEIDLDDWVGQFELVIDTQAHPPQETLALALEHINEKISN
jgi:hypothetical protein